MSSRLRLSVLGVVIVSLFAVMFARLWYLQVLAAPEFEVAASQNRVRVVTTPAPRGRILDRHGRVLVDNRYANVVTITRDEIENRDAVLGRLSALLRIPVAELRARMANPRYSPYKPVPVAEDVPKETLVYISEHQDLFPGVEATRQAVRTYPNGTLAAHLLGYVGEINDVELDARKGDGYRLGDTIGKTGVEKIYEDDLRGEPGVERLQVDARGKSLGPLSVTPPVQGHDVVLTIDLEVQRLAEESLAKGIEAARKAKDRASDKNFAAPAGAAVVLDPRNGAVLALASHPTYDPAAFLNGISRGDYAFLQDPANHYPLNDRTIQGQYAPGSTFKLITALAGLRTGLIQPNSTVVDRGFLRVGNRTFRNAGSRAYGPVNLQRSLTVSSDVYYYTMGASFWSKRDQLGETPIQDTARLFGLGETTGIPLRPEMDGRVPDPEGRKELHELKPKAFPEGKWYPGDNVNLSIGQGETVVTPLQLANAYATFANGGTLWEPRIAAEVRDRGGDVVRTIDSVVRRKIDLPPQQRDPILRGLVGVTADPRGTANGAFFGFPLNRFPVAGKTGTAQVAGKQDTALFASFAPANSPTPEYAVVAVVEEAGFGGSVAAPIVRRIYDGIVGEATTDVTLQGGVD
jgi:penicillin-binding protein 2